ncbi:hypothetical protein OIU84_020374 [Salix udensis]|uniref:Uncharacterized protein n=1 Tax=Salix udensis TaxID=889485 RepID=A0AAD6KS42_9ROSI|nr:hypothetical protein OIU84_020374 [Salix udensis]
MHRNLKPDPGKPEEAVCGDGLRRKGGSTQLRFGGGLDGTAVQGGRLEEGGVAVSSFDIFVDVVAYDCMS